jgi:hypothetical protein
MSTINRATEQPSNRQPIRFRQGSAERAHCTGGPRGARTHNPRIKGRRIAAAVASPCDYVLTAVPISPTSGPWLTAFHATNHATPMRIGTVRLLGGCPRPPMTKITAPGPDDASTATVRTTWRASRTPPGQTRTGYLGTI